MPMQTVELRFITGLSRQIFSNLRVVGSWERKGRYSQIWSEAPMAESVGQDGCPIFIARVKLDLRDRHETFRWGVLLDGPQGANLWGIPTEVQDMHSTACERSFRLAEDGPQVESYYFSYYRRLGANKYYAVTGAPPNLCFAVWAPNAQSVEVVFSRPNHGYIADNGAGIDPRRPIIALDRQEGGIWQSEPQPDFASFVGLPYMYRIVSPQGQTLYRTDIFSRHQIGCGGIDPAMQPWPGTLATLDGTKSCSVVVDPDTICRDFAPAPGEPPVMISADEFWSHEFNPATPVPSRVEDLVIYELHIGALGFGKSRPGNLADAIELLDHLVELGVNAVELLPMSEFSGNIGWGYGDTHHFVIESSAGGRDQYKHFVRECHRRGIAVIQDVVYNHYDYSSLRAQWEYDSTAPEQNIYYWYEGLPSHYPRSDGGYLNNGSSGYAPRYWEEVVRQQFISSALCFVEELHVDGLRVDLTQAIHRDNSLNADGRPVDSANVFGQKLLREWSRTLRMVHPSVILIAEDHTGWDGVTRSAALGGLGFDATWYAAFYHNLVGDAEAASGEAQLLKRAGLGGNEPLRFDKLAHVLYESRYDKVVFHESHDEAGNARASARTLVVAVNGAPLWAETRRVGEARARVVFGLSLLSAGTPMFFMGEEIGAQRPYTYTTFFDNRENILGERHGQGAGMFRYYQDIITLSRRLSSIRTHNIDILHQSGANRVIAFKRWRADEELMVVASLNNAPFDRGYWLHSNRFGLPNASWHEVFNSDSAIYGGRNVGNQGATLTSAHGALELRIPANGLVVLVRQ